MPLSSDPNPLPVLFTSPNWIDRSLLGWKFMLINQILVFYRFLRSQVLTHQPQSIYIHIIHTIPGTSPGPLHHSHIPMAQPSCHLQFFHHGQAGVTLGTAAHQKGLHQVGLGCLTEGGRERYRTFQENIGKPTLFHHIRIQNDTKTEAFSKASIEHIERTSQCML